MIDWFKGFVLNFVLAALLAGLFLLPDHLFQAVTLGYQAAFGEKVVLGIYLITLFALASRSLWVIKAVALFFAALQLAQFFHFSYFGTLISPHAVAILFTDFGEITESLFSDMGRVLLPLAIVGGVYGAAFWLLGRIDAHRQPVPLFGVMLVLVLAIGPVKAYNAGSSQTFYPNPRHYAIKNTYYALSYFLGKSLPEKIEGRELPSFEPYRLEERAFTGPMNLVLIMGKSVNPEHMSLFGFERDTTPRLRGLLDDPSFVATRAIAGGINTKVAVQTFFNLKHEPANVQHLFRQDANLMAMAKRRGMTTHYISAQTANLATYLGDGQIDHFFSKEDDVEGVMRKYDEILIERLDRIDLGRSNCIVLHQRGSHSPYEKFHPDRFDRYPEDVEDDHARRVNTYHNSLYFTDHVTAELIGRLRSKSTLPVYVVFVSDHGELMGEDGKYGHSMLEPGVANIPFLFYAINGRPEIIEAARALSMPTHYEIGEFVAG
ncbi:MAG: hypothetical protein B0D82_02830, partial [Candidatus Sedimenticola endophacoides]